jgi:hypothetical protein
MLSELPGPAENVPRALFPAPSTVEITRANFGAMGAVWPSTRLRKVYRVEFFSRDVPYCYRGWAIPEFSNSARVIWVASRKRRDELLCCDRSARWQAHEYRQCQRCGRKIIGLAARIRRDDEEMARLKGLPDPPCSKECEQHTSQERAFA